MAVSKGDRVTVHGAEYTVTDKQSAASSGSKFFGKFRFTLRDSTGATFTAFGKTVGHNSRLTAR